MMKRHLRGTLVSLAAMTIAGSAAAQTFPSASPVPDPQTTDTGTPSTAEAAENGVGDIVVTARRVEERLQDIPIAISAVSGASLQQQGIREIRDLSAVVPNLNIQAGNTGAGTAVIAIRGQSQTNVIPTVDSSVGFYVDNVNVPVTEDVAIRLVGQRSKHDGYGTNVNTPNDPNLLDNDSTYLRGKLKADLGNLTASLTVDHSRLSGGGFVPRIVALNPLVQTGTNPPGGNATREVALELGLAPNAASLTPANLAQAAAVLQSYIGRPGFYDSFGTSPHKMEGRSTSAALTLDWKASADLTLRSITGYRRVSSDWRADNDGTPFVLNQNHQYNSSRFISEEFQILGGNKKFNWVTGLFYSNERAFALEESYTFRLLSNNNLSTNSGDIGNDSYAVFGQANYEIVNGLTFTAGARYTKEKRSLISNNFTQLTGCRLAPAVLDDGVNCRATFKVSFEKPTWLASLNYQITPDIMAYGKVSRGFRGGGLNLRASGTNLAVYNPFAPEIVTEYEIGLKSELFNRRLRLNLAAFYDDYENVQRNVLILINGVSTTLVTNAAKARLKGIEGEAELRATDWLRLSGGFGYLDPKYTNFVDLTGDRSNEPWPAPKWNYTLGARATRSTPIGPLSADVNWAWQGRLTLTPTAPAPILPFVTQKAYGLLSARVALAITDWDAEVAIFGRNLTQQRYFTSGIAFEAAGFSQLQTGEPRTFGLQFTKRFGAID